MAFKVRPYQWLRIYELTKRGFLGGHQTRKLDFWEHYIYGKQNRVKFSIGVHRMWENLDYIHSNLWDLSNVPSHNGARYMLTFIDDYSRKNCIYVLKQKNDVFLERYLGKVDEESKWTKHCLRELEVYFLMQVYLSNFG